MLGMHVYNILNSKTQENKCPRQVSCNLQHSCKFTQGGNRQFTEERLILSTANLNSAQ